MLRLGVNIDHVATVRNARGGAHPDPVRAARIAMEAGADGITAHLREDRRHIRDGDIARLKAKIPLPLNLEMAATQDMLAIALAVHPHAVCLVPEKREERTTEGGLDVAGQQAMLKPFTAALQEAGIRVSLFIEPSRAQVDAAKACGAKVVEFHTGTYAEASLSPAGGRPGGGHAGQNSCPTRIHPNPLPKEEGNAQHHELQRIRDAAAYAHWLGIECHAGHGLNFENVGPIAAIPQLVELNIGHFLIGEAIFLGLKEAICEMRRRMEAEKSLL